MGMAQNGIRAENLYWRIRTVLEVVRLLLWVIAQIVLAALQNA